jgi:glycosyltransferase involved in cell wall biosynthesis
MPLVSIIVPVYNAEPYLPACLNSLVSQTLKDIEIICINDFSPDSSISILKEYASKDKRIKIIDFDKNHGVSVARNCGIETAIGEYVGFMDSDDYADLDFYEKLYNMAKKTDSDIAKGNIKIKEPDFVREYAVNINEAIRKNKANFLWQFWAAIYKTDFLKKNSIKFPLGMPPEEDDPFIVMAVAVANKIECEDSVHYYYIRRESSAYTKVFSKEKLIDITSGAVPVFDFLKKANINKEHYEKVFKYLLFHLLSLISRNPDKECQKIVMDSVMKFLSDCKYTDIAEAFPKTIVSDKNYTKSLNGTYPKIEIAKNILKKKKLYIWGAGLDGAYVLGQCEKNKWKIEGFLDSNPALTEFNGYPVITPQTLLNHKPSERTEFIIISSRIFSANIAEICENNGLQRDMNFWQPF